MQRLLISLMILTSLVTSVPALALPDVAAVRAALVQDTELAAAQARQQVAASAAKVLSSSPYEWTASLNIQQRQIQGENNSQEWNAALERGLRLPNKGRLDRQQAELTRRVAEQEFVRQRQDTARELLDQWLAWAQVRERRSLLEQQQVLIDSYLVGVRQRIRSGDGAMQEETLAQADQSALSAQLANTKLAEQQAEINLRSRFPSLVMDDSMLPSPISPDGDAENWRQRIMAVNPRLAIAQLQAEQARIQAARQQQERLPDPTLGIFTASEAHNSERVIGVSLSVPLSGQRRQQQAMLALAEARAVEQSLKAEVRQQEVEAALAWMRADNQYRIWQLTANSAKAQTLAAERGWKGFMLGETGLQELLQLRRQALAATDAELAARATAWQAIIGLQIAGLRGWLAE